MRVARRVNKAFGLAAPKSEHGKWMASLKETLKLLQEKCKRLWRPSRRNKFEAKRVRSKFRLWRRLYALTFQDAHIRIAE